MAAVMKCAGSGRSSLRLALGRGWPVVLLLMGSRMLEILEQFAFKFERASSIPASRLHFAELRGMMVARKEGRKGEGEGRGKDVTISFVCAHVKRRLLKPVELQKLVVLSWKKLGCGLYRARLLFPGCWRHW
jgi:hypothetical protein